MSISGCEERRGEGAGDCEYKLLMNEHLPRRLLKLIGCAEVHNDKQIYKKRG